MGRTWSGVRPAEVQAYRHQPIRRVHIPKDGGGPIGISALEDKMVQSAVRHVLEAIYEQDFLAGSGHGMPMRPSEPGRKVVHRGEVNDTGGRHRVLLRQFGSHQAERDAPGSGDRWLARVGVLDGEAYTTPDRGTGVRALAVVG